MQTHYSAIDTFVSPQTDSQFSKQCASQGLGFIVIRFHIVSLIVIQGSESRLLYYGTAQERNTPRSIHPIRRAKWFPCLIMRSSREWFTFPTMRSLRVPCKFRALLPFYTLDRLSYGCPTPQDLHQNYDTCV
jgi:hypothetical protein